MVGCRSAACIFSIRGTRNSLRSWHRTIREKAISRAALWRAPYGKGTYIYTGYAFFRQLPAGVPGALRLYVNLLAAGHEAGDKH